jgi:hypothetical protein
MPRHKDDYYVTPQDTIIEFLEAWRKLEPGALDAFHILDPCAGGCAKHGMAYPEALERMGVPDYHITTNDIRGDSPASGHRDYLMTGDVNLRYNLIISNPPFSLGQEFVEQAFRDVHPGGRVAFFFRLTFFGSQKRRAWWQSHMPRYVFVHSKRPKLDPNTPSGNDSCDYAHVVWYPSHMTDHAEMRII